jgi:rubrerythrin
MKMVEVVKNARKTEEKAEREYRKLLRALDKPEYADLRGLVLRMAVDTIFHRHLMEALEKAHNEAMELVGRYLEEKPAEDLVLIPGVPTIVLPLGFGPVGARVHPEELIEEFLKEFPTNVMVPEGKHVTEELVKVKELAGEMKKLYEELSKRAFHPVVREIAEGIRRNEEQHEAFVEGIIKRSKGPVEGE